MAAADDTPNVRFKVGDVEYEIPPVDDFDMDEWQIVYDYSGLVLDDFAIAADAATTEKAEDGTVKVIGEDGPDEKARQRRVGQPAFMRSLLHIGYRRVHPDAKDADVRKLTGELKMTELFQDQVEDDAGPPEKAATSSAAASSASGSESAPRHSLEDFGRTGKPSRSYWDARIGHVLPAINRENVGSLTPDDLMLAVQLFDAKYSEPD